MLLKSGNLEVGLLQIGKYYLLLVSKIIQLLEQNGPLSLMILNIALELSYPRLQYFHSRSDSIVRIIRMSFLTAHSLLPVFALFFSLFAFQHVDFLFGSLDGTRQYFLDGVGL